MDLKLFFTKFLSVIMGLAFVVVLQGDASAAKKQNYRQKKAKLVSAKFYKNKYNRVVYVKHKHQKSPLKRQDNAFLSKTTSAGYYLAQIDAKNYNGAKLNNKFSRTPIRHWRKSLASRSYRSAIARLSYLSSQEDVFNGKDVKVIDMVATAYEPGPISCGKYASGYTAIGYKASKGIVAVDPRIIPLGTIVYIEGYGYAIAADVGSAIKGYRIDLCFDTYREAISFGRRRIKVYIVDKNVHFNK